MSQARTYISNVNGVQWEVIARFIDIGGIVIRQSLNIAITQYADTNDGTMAYVLITYIQCYIVEPI